MFNSYVRLPEGHKGDGVEGWEIPPPKNHSHGIKPMTSVFIDAKPCDPSNHREINCFYVLLLLLTLLLLLLVVVVVVVCNVMSCHVM